MGPTMKVTFAMQRLNAKPMVRFMKSFTDHALGKTALSAASTLLQVTAKESAAVEKLRRARSALSDDRLPKLVLQSANGQSATVAQVANFELLSSGTLADILQESLVDMMEGCSLFSQVGIADQRGEIEEWCSAIVKSMTFYDECLSLHLQALLSKGGFYHIMQGVANDGADASCGPQGDGLTHSDISKLRVLLDDNCATEETLQTFASNLQSFLKTTRPACLADSERLAELSRLMDTGFMNNTEVRGDILNILEVISDFNGDLPVDGKAALADWRGKQILGKESDCFLTRAISLQHALDDLATRQLNMDNDHEAEDCALVLADGCERLTGSYKKAAMMAEDLLGAPLVAHIRKVAGQAIQRIVSEFASSLRLDTVAFPTPVMGSPTVDNVSNILGSFMSKGDHNELMKGVGRIFANGGKKNFVWPCKSLLELLSKLCAILPGDDMDLDLSDFVAPPVPPQPPVPKAKLMLLFDLMCGMAQTTQTIGFLRLKCCGAESMLRENKLKEEVELGMNSAIATTNKFAESLESSHPQNVFPQAGGGFTETLGRNGCVSWGKGQVCEPIQSRVWCMKVPSGQTRVISLVGWFIDLPAFLSV